MIQLHFLTLLPSASRPIYLNLSIDHMQRHPAVDQSRLNFLTNTGTYYEFYDIHRIIVLKF